MNDADNESPTSYYGPRQVHCPRRALIANFDGGSGAGGTVVLRLPTPDARLHGGYALIGVPAPESGTALPATVLAGRGITVWPYASSADQANGGRFVPVSDQIPGVTQASPLAIPVHAGLGGFGREFVTISDALELEIVIPPQLGGVIGALYAQARYQPVSSSGFIPWEQWQEIRSGLEFIVLGGPLHT